MSFYVLIRDDDVGSRFAVGADGAVVWDAQPPSGTTKVEFLIDGAVRATTTASPYSYNVPPLSAGSHEFVLRIDGQADAPVSVLVGDAAAAALLAFWDDIKDATNYKQFKQKNQGETQRLRNYANGGSRPTMITPLGKTLADQLDAYFAHDLPPFSLP